jgi:nucleoside-diphosphate-sugar epimerase
MKVLIVGATGSIGRAILQRILRQSDFDHVVALTRRPLSLDITNDAFENIIVQNFGDLESVPDSTWEKIQDADALIWAMGTYDLNEHVNLKYPLAFQEAFAQRMLNSSRQQKFRFLLLSGAFVEPNQARNLFFLPDQRHMKGLLHTKTLDFAEAHQNVWEAIIVRPGGILFGGDTLMNRAGECIFGSGLAIRAEELAASVAHLVINGSSHPVVENLELVENGRKSLQESNVVRLRG